MMNRTRVAAEQGLPLCYSTLMVVARMDIGRSTSSNYISGSTLLWYSVERIAVSCTAQDCVCHRKWCTQDYVVSGYSVHSST